MLVLTRKVGQSIVIADDIIVKIVGIDGDQIKLGIEAPHHIEIHRQEIYQAIQQENHLASENSLDINVLKQITLKKQELQIKNK
ncbi:carbon storage regulator CsrA [Aneurinibacillus sp. REN35]|uniref:carbon storage regulator CsrA n=1 Tax=Aneurinibacillus sp. REN35 TaxID=3237286 RepID=UPI003528180F